MSSDSITLLLVVALFLGLIAESLIFAIVLSEIKRTLARLKHPKKDSQ